MATPKAEIKLTQGSQSSKRRQELNETENGAISLSIDSPDKRMINQKITAPMGIRIMGNAYKLEQQENPSMSEDSVEKNERDSLLLMNKNDPVAGKPFKNQGNKVVRNSSAGEDSTIIFKDTALKLQVNPSSTE